MKLNNEPAIVKALRLKAGLTQKSCSIIYGVGLRAWQKKEEDNPQNSQKLSKVEFEYLLLLAGEHPDYVLNKRDNLSNASFEQRIKLPDERFIYHDSDYDDGYVKGWNKYRLEAIHAIHEAGGKVEGVEEDDFI